MARNLFKTNMIASGPRQRMPKPGDLFAVNMLGKIWVVGRVIHMDSQMLGGGGDEPLIYFYKMSVNDPELLRPPFKPDLLIPPVVTSTKCWKLRFFRTLGNYPVLTEERLARHYFSRKSMTGDRVYFVDEFQEPSPIPLESEYCATSGLTTYTGIDDLLSAAMGIQPASDETDRQSPPP